LAAPGVCGPRCSSIGNSAAAFTPSENHSDGIFTHTPEPTRENLTGLCKLVKKKKAAVGFAQDPDADRLAIVDERGHYIGEEYTLVLAAEALLGGAKRRKAKGKGDLVLVTNLSTSRMLDDVAEKYGARVVRTAVGEANVVEAMKREKAAGNRVVLGGEGNGGVIWPEVTYVRDSLSSMALVLSLMARTGKKVSELVAEMPAYSIEKRKVEIPRREHARPAVEKLAAEYAAQKLDLQDGVRVDWLEKRAWLHVRASNTEPIMRLIAEAPTAAEATAILEDAADVIAG
jgi:phosphomannomutase